MPNEYVLVHGAFHGAWCRDDVAERLRAKGHLVVTLDLPGHGRRAAEIGRAGAEAYGRAVADIMALEGISRGIVVGHSMGGLVIPKAAELAPARVPGLSRRGGRARRREPGRNADDASRPRRGGRQRRVSWQRHLSLPGRDGLGPVDG